MDYQVVQSILSILVGVIGAYYAREQVRLLKEAQVSPSSKAKRQTKIPRFLGLKLYGPIVALVVLVLAAWVPHFTGGYSVEKWRSRPSIQVRDKIFRFETVKLDGHEYINCDFDNVTFEFQGMAPTRLTNSRIKVAGGGRVVRIKSTNPVVNQTTLLIDMLSDVAGIKGWVVESENKPPL